MNGIDLLLADHRRVDELFAEFAASRDGVLIGSVLDALAAHDDAEHAALYPLALELVGDRKLIERCLAAHVEVRNQIDHVRQLEGAPLVTAFMELRDLVTRHVRDEEERLLPALAQAATPSQLDGLAAKIGQVKQRVG